MNHSVIVLNMLSGERIKAHWASCFFISNWNATTCRKKLKSW